MSLVMTGAPALEPVTLAEAKAHLRVDTALEDTFIASLITTSRLQVEAILGLALITQNWTWRFDAWPRGGIEFPLAPVSAVGLVRTQNSDQSFATIAAANYIVDGRGTPPRLVPSSTSFPKPGAVALGIEIQFTAGVRRACRGCASPLAAGDLVARRALVRKPRAVCRRRNAKEFSRCCHRASRTVPGAPLMSTQPIGNLRHGLIIEAPLRTGDDAASAATSWSFVATVWAAIRAVSGREIVDADGVSARVSHQITIRWRSDLTAAMRFHDGTRIFLIHGLRDVDDTRRRLTCLVEELAS